MLNFFGPSLTWHVNGRILPIKPYLYYLIKFLFKRRFELTVPNHVASNSLTWAIFMVKNNARNVPDRNSIIFSVKNFYPNQIKYFFLFLSGWIALFAIKKKRSCFMVWLGFRLKIETFLYGTVRGIDSDLFVIKTCGKI